jgi:SAM-dependent methyltransferase
MPFKDADIKKLEAFLEKIESETYAEAASDLHTKVTENMLNPLLDNLKLPPSAQILDVGCGQGVALTIFQQRGYQPIGITLNDEDVEKSIEAGFDVRKMDQSFLDFPDGSFDLLWARHVLEHSIFPYFTLWEYGRVVKSGGIVYVEVPAPDTAARHQTNPNHYSVLPKSTWESLLLRSGFSILHFQEIKLQLQAGEDIYMAFICRKSG